MKYPKILIDKVNQRSKGFNLEGINEGAGPNEPALMIVGEAPGREEIESHIPFHGASGKELMKSLASIGLKREEVYITSAVRSRPFGVKKVFSKRENKEVTKYPNRKPTQKEVLAHAPFLDYEIKNVKPKVIVAVGTTALRRLLGKDYSISEYHGKAIKNTPILQLNEKENGFVWSKQKYTVIAMYHPAAVFYNRKLSKIIENDWLNVKAYIKKPK
ncbi:uracil-DNA glycosylase [uncultured Lactobacillus sp.]|uniref:uracil-DNA glycosylase n=1 Tax=uncultured Lactobacillus sp. TaxID=153152 RepID=UPI00261512A5|nr:uracil-DNA glycosylase [uncultured Lactobacillus sp.]